MLENQAKEAKIIVIGGGVSGLSAACFAQMNGFNATVIERHDRPGGCCTSWERRGYTFDPCVSWLNGSGNDNNDELSQVWRDLNTFDGKVINQVEVFNTVKFPSGNQIQFYCDPDKLEPHLLAISPQDGDLIRQYCNYVRDFRKCGRFFPFLKATGLRNLWDKSKLMWNLLPYMRTFTKTMGITVNEFSAQFKHPELSEAFRYILFDAIDGLPLLPSCINTANAADNNAGVPAEGSYSISQAVEKRMLELGADIRYKTMVNKILVKDDRAYGVELTTGEILEADIVIGASDGYNQIYKMLDGKYTSPQIDQAYASFDKAPQDIFPGTVCMFLGVDADYTHLPSFSTYILSDEERAKVPGLNDSGISVQIRNKLIPSSAPAGKSVIYISFLSDYNYWEKLDQQDVKPSRAGVRKTSEAKTHTKRKRSLAYRQSKNELAAQVIALLEQRHPGLTEQIEYTDVATPLTCLRYTENRHGSIFGWTPLTDTNDLIEDEIARLRGKLPGLAGFYMAGHWLGNGGVTRAAHSGRHALQYICHDLKQPFVVKPKASEQFSLIECMV